MGVVIETCAKCLGGPTSINATGMLQHMIIRPLNCAVPSGAVHLRHGK
jgi:hypothetical protein